MPLWAHPLRCTSVSFSSFNQISHLRPRAQVQKVYRLRIRQKHRLLKQVYSFCDVSLMFLSDHYIRLGFVYGQIVVILVKELPFA